MEELKNTTDLKKMLEILNYFNENFCNIEYLYYEEDEEESEDEKQIKKEEQKDENEDEEMYYSMTKKPKKTIDLENEGKLVTKKINCKLEKFHLLLKFLHFSENLGFL